MEQTAYCVVSCRSPGLTRVSTMYLERSSRCCVSVNSKMKQARCCQVLASSCICANWFGTAPLVKPTVHRQLSSSHCGFNLTHLRCATFQIQSVDNAPGDGVVYARA